MSITPWIVIVVSLLNVGIKAGEYPNKKAPGYELVSLLLLLFFALGDLFLWGKK